jgi:hypothetical protein
VVARESRQGTRPLLRRSWRWHFECFPLRRAWASVIHIRVRRCDESSSARRATMSITSKKNVAYWWSRCGALSKAPGPTCPGYEPRDDGRSVQRTGRSAARAASVAGARDRCNGSLDGVFTAPLRRCRAVIRSRLQRQRLLGRQIPVMPRNLSHPVRRSPRPRTSHRRSGHNCSRRPRSGTDPTLAPPT